MESEPAVSVVLPLYNTERFVAWAIRSVLAQTFADFELVVVNDGSTDGSVAVVEAFSDRRIRIIHQANRGLAGARNSGIRNARGRFIAFLDADDGWMPEKLERHVALLSSAPSVGVSYSYSAMMDGHGEPLGIFQARGSNPTTLAHIVCQNPIGNGSSAVVRAAVFDPDHPKNRRRAVAHLLFDEDLRQAEDYELWIRIATQTEWAFHCIRWPLTCYRVGSGGVSSDVNSQRGYHYLALVKARAYAPQVIERYRTASIATLHWFLARVLLLDGRPRDAILFCRVASRFDPGSLRLDGLLLIAAAVAKCLLPVRLYRSIERLGLRLRGMFQRHRFETPAGGVGRRKRIRGPARFAR